jgi:hypothetical protein
MSKLNRAAGRIDSDRPEPDCAVNYVWQRDLATNIKTVGHRLGELGYHAAYQGKNGTCLPISISRPRPSTRRCAHTGIADNLLDVLARVDDGPGRRTDARGRLVIEEGDGFLLDRLARWHRERPVRKEVLLVDQHEKDVVARRHRSGRRLRSRRCVGLGVGRPTSKDRRAEQRRA